MPKQPTEPRKSGLVQPDRAVLLARKEASQRVEEMKLRLVVLVDRYFDQSLRIIKNWLQEDDKGSGQKKR
jgi:hypothetical protein